MLKKKRFGYLLEAILTYPKHVLWGNKNKTRLVLHISMLIKYSVQKQNHFNGNVFGTNAVVHCIRCPRSLLMARVYTDCNLQDSTFLGHWLWRHVNQRTTKPAKWHVCPAKTDQPGHPPSLIRVFAVHMKKAWSLATHWAQRRLQSDWADTQADLSLRWLHKSYCRFFVMHWLIWFASSISRTGILSRRMLVVPFVIVNIKFEICLLLSFSYPRRHFSYAKQILVCL